MRGLVTYKREKKDVIGERLSLGGQKVDFQQKGSKRDVSCGKKGFAAPAAPLLGAADARLLVALVLLVHTYSRVYQHTILNYTFQNFDNCWSKY